MAKGLDAAWRLAGDALVSTATGQLASLLTRGPAGLLTPQPAAAASAGAGSSSGPDALLQVRI
jgi:hypothetical protein